ncbi:lipopolysaccharide heptosyltransferase I [Geobacter argillaceus]|uniref:Lipopolysaccharide heptosyltransferase 1 n=1 Tax=Geobacter argillaceus TaxID=345631 RepID=A0A562VNH2_9BACT|nr:lipopolysaccharide heptosyltransferase I [Geobacter argillaceus]TWJ19294.1 heptosyltransferase-1 [Geobacter argillaceus]
MKIAIIRLSSLGDIVFGMASLQLIRRAFPDCSITWIADSRFADILDGNPDLERIVKLDLKKLKGRFSLGGLQAQLAKLEGLGPFDMIIDLHGMLKSALIARRLGGVRTGFHRSVVKEPLATLFYSRTVTVPFSEPAVHRYAALIVQSLGFTMDPTELVGKHPFLGHRPGDEEATKGLFRTDRKNIIMVPETSIAYKNYPKEKLIAVADRLKQNILVCHGSPAELESANYLAEHSPYVTILPRLDLNQLKAAISRADLVIGGDTGPTHMAWASNVPSLALFGATAPPYAPTDRHRVLTSGSRVNTAKPDRNDFSVSTIAVEEVVRQAEELLL